MKRTSLLLAITTSIVSCSASHASQVVDATSGVRLRAWVDEGGNGARRFVHWRDTELDVDCSFYEAPDGAYRCLEDRFAIVAFTDAACTDPIVATYGEDDGTTHYVNDFGASDACAFGSLGAIGAQLGATGGLGGLGGAVQSATAVHTIGTARATPATFYRMSAGTCSATASGGTASPLRFAELGEEVSFDHFARATRVESPRADGLTVVQLEAEDGAQQTYDIHRTSDGSSCQAVQLEDGWHCATNLALRYGNVFVDAACTAPSAAVYPTSAATCPAPTHVLIGDACGPAALHALLAPAAATFSTASGTCEPTTLGMSAVPWSVGARVDADALDAIAPPMALTIFGDGPLRVTAYADADRASLAARGWETSDGAPCTPLVIGTRTVCTRPANVGQWFADASCTTRLVAASCHTPTPTVAYIADEAALHAIGDLYEGPVFTSSLGAECTATTSPAGVTLRSLGAVIPADSLPEIRRVLD